MQRKCRSEMSTRAAEETRRRRAYGCGTSALLQQVGRGRVASQRSRERSRRQIEPTAASEVRVLVYEHGALGSADFAPAHDGGDVAVLVQSELESPGVFAERVQRRLESIGSSGRRVERATIALNRRSGEQALQLRGSIARGILRIMRETHLSELAFVASSSGGAQRGELLGLVESLLSGASGLKPSVRVRFDKEPCPHRVAGEG